MNPKTRFLILLKSITGVGDVSARLLAERFETVDQLKDVSPNELETFLRGQFRQTALSELSDPNTVKGAARTADRILCRCRALDIIPISCFDDAYPFSLSSLPDRPVVLFVRGNRSLLCREKNIAVVGTRECTEWGRTWARCVCDYFVERGFAVTSGFARGIDYTAHTAALKAHGPTIGVLANGLEKVLPLCHTDLGRKALAHDGLLISENPPDWQVRPGDFVRRDRMISGISSLLFVIESGIAGGAMITAGFARRQGIPVACPLPEDPRHPKQQGLIKLINEGAFPLRNTGDLAVVAGQRRASLFQGVRQIHFNESPV